MKVDAGSLVGARAHTAVGWGAVISVRDVSVQCEVATVSSNKAETGVGDLTVKPTSTSYNSTGDGTNFDAGEGQRTVSGNDAGEHHPVLSPSVVERGPTGSSGSLWEDESNRRRDGHGGHNEDGAEPPDRRKRQEEGFEHSTPPPTVFKSCLNERVIHVASKKGPPGESGAYGQVGDDRRRLRSSDDSDEWNDWEGCSEGTERAAELDGWAATTEHGRTREDFTPGQIGAGSWTALEGMYVNCIEG